MPWIWQILLVRDEFINGACAFNGDLKKLSTGILTLVVIQVGEGEENFKKG